MYIKQLLITDFRNLEYVELEPCSGFNFICGPNGSGKTSIIEAIHYLSLARSFRTSTYQYLIKQGQPHFTLFAQVQEDGSEVDTSIGLLRPRNGEPLIKINSDPITRMVDLIDHIYVQIIHPQGVDLLTKSAEMRRAFIDWGVYYTDPEFKQLWLQYRKTLKQRNSLLRRLTPKRRPDCASDYSSSALTALQGDAHLTLHDAWAQGGSAFGGGFTELSVWDEAVARLSEQITHKRLAYLERLQVILQEIVGQFLPDFRLKFELNQGWDKGQDLRHLLAQNLEKDRGLGYTLYGCHRADLKIKNNNLSAGATLSRGQLKMLVYAMRLAQGMLLRQLTNRTCIYLIDDLNSELDERAQRILLDTLVQCEHQVFISNIQQELHFPSDQSKCKVFTLDRGKLVPHAPAPAPDAPAQYASATPNVPTAPAASVEAAASAPEEATVARAAARAEGAAAQEPAAV